MIYYFVLGFEEYVNPKTGLSGWIYYIGKNLGQGAKPCFRVFAGDRLPGVNVMDRVIPDLEESRGSEGYQVHVRGIFKIDQSGEEDVI